MQGSKQHCWDDEIIVPITLDMKLIADLSFIRSSVQRHFNVVMLSGVNEIDIATESMTKSS